MVTMDIVDFNHQQHHGAVLDHHQAFSTSSASRGTSNGPTPSPSPIIRRRAPIACRRCRRMRSKCVHDNARPPCKACGEAGLGEEDCIFPVRGQPDDDRQYRHPRIRASKQVNKKDTARNRRSTLGSTLGSPSSAPVDEWEDLPPLSEIIDAVNRFTRHYFQLGFIPKQQFPERLRKDHRSVNLFLLLSILSISARLSPALTTRYGTGVRAAEFFMVRAAAMAMRELYQEPTLERCQGFYLLSIAQQGNGIRNQSHINMGIAMRLATLMQLHREETYQIYNPTPDLVIRAESARRTLWMLHSQDSLHSGPYSPVSLAAPDITALLPCDEADFAAGRQPRSRAALADTPPAIENPSLVCDPNRSLFASLMQMHHVWGIVGRRAASYGCSSCPCGPGSEFSRITVKLQEWESSLPKEHTWSPAILQRHKAERQDLAYLGVTMVTRLCHIVARRPYLGDIIDIEQKDTEQRLFFTTVSTQLFSNVHKLFEQINAQFTARSPDESVGGQMAAFCVYSCALFSAYLCKYPNICPDRAVVDAGPHMLFRTRSILVECKEVWPLASRWLESLDKFFCDPQAIAPIAEGSMADGKDNVPHILHRGTLPSPAQEAQDVSSSFSSSTYSHPTPFPQPQPLPSQQIHPHTDAFSHPQHAFHLQNGGQLLHGQYPHQQQPQNALGLTQTHSQTALPLVDGLGILVEAFGQAQGAPAGPRPYHMTTAPAGTVSFIPGTLGPHTDGFEDELQHYIGGATEWMQQAGGWMDGY